MTTAAQEALTAKDGYVARDFLAHEPCRELSSATQRRALYDVVQLSGIDHGSIPDSLMTDLLAAIGISEVVTARHNRCTLRSPHGGGKQPRAGSG